ncbi:MAG: universal stress protein [Granulosicoccaceae bacterium]|jgi:nucleotide-binding universal stress UspA family protein
MKRFKNILCVIDRQSAEQYSLEQAVALAENNQARVTVVMVTEPVHTAVSVSQEWTSPFALQERLTDTQAQYLDTLIEPYKARIEITTKVLSGTPFLEVIREVLRNAHDMVIKCPESPEWLNRFFSGDDMHLLRKCPCPVWMVKPQTRKTYHSILAAVDVDDSYPSEEIKTRQALNGMVMELAGSLAVSEFAQLHVAHAWEAIAESALRHGAFMQGAEDEVNTYVEQVRRHHAQLLDTLMKEVSAKLGQDAIDYIKPQLHMPKGAARKEIPELARQLQVDCIVMGTVARTGVRGFIMGNTAETILEQINCSVIAIKPPGFVTPVTLEE